MNLGNLAVKVKLALAFGLLSAVILIVSAIALTELNEANARFTGFIGGINARADAAELIRNAVDDRAIAVRNLVLVTKAEDVEIEKKAVNVAVQEVQTRLERFNSMVASAPDMSDEGRRLAAEIPRIEEAYRPVALDIARLAMDNQRDAAIAEIDVKCRPLLSALIKASKEYASYTHARADQLEKQSEDVFVTQRRLLIAICIGAIGLGLVAGVLITRDLFRILGAEPSTLGEVTLRVAAGDLRPVAGATHAPVGSVLASMGAMQISLVRLIDGVRIAATNIATGSSQIASGNIDLSSRTEQQAASLQETASTMEALTSTVKLNEENAKQASLLAASASLIANKGSDVVGQVMGTMDEIRKSSNKIGEITGIIESIAFQTNILALNAAVEAARAGEQGRGFAVVASEVRILAQRSSAASKDIKNLIITSGQKIQDGSLLASAAGETMSEVTRAVTRVTDIMGEIAAASTEQTRGIEQVNEAISQMDQVTQRNAALVEEAAAASQSLEQQGRQLNDAIAFFQLDATNVKPALNVRESSRFAPALLAV